MGNKPQVGVIFGGKSGEHEVSIVSSRSIMSAIDRERYDVVPIGITQSGRWITQGDPMALLTGGGRDNPESPPLPPFGDQGIGSRELVPGATGSAFPSVDVVFPVLHGPYGEDGTIQGLLEMAGVPFVGCGVLASALAMDKIACKQALMAHGIPVVPGEAVLRRHWETAPVSVLEHLEGSFSYPVFVKPANLGSSIGISKAKDRAQLSDALNEASRYDRRLLVEAAIPNAREIECSVLGNDEPIASLPGEVIPSREFYDYRAKYIDEDSRLIIPAKLPAEMTRQIQEWAIKAFMAIDGSGLARVDFLLDGISGQLYMNELNTMPGFTKISMYPKLWEASGISYPELVDRLIELALERHTDKTRSISRYQGAISTD